jgi:site-specific recombinase XerD
MQLLKAIEGFVIAKLASGYSPNTVENYRIQLAKLKAYFPDDPIFTSITRSELVEFFAWLQDDYVSEAKRPIPHSPAKLSSTSILNIHTSLVTRIK